jgi:beta-lactamase class A
VKYVVTLLSALLLLTGTVLMPTLNSEQEKSPQSAEVNSDAQSFSANAADTLALSSAKPTTEQFDLLNRELERHLAINQGYTCSVYVKFLSPSSEPIIINSEKIRAASMIKIFVMAEAFRQAKEGLIRMDEEFVVSRDVKVGGSGSLQGVPDGTRRTMRNLIELMITESDNTATNIIIDRLSMESINKLIAGFGFKDTILQRKMMDMQSIINGRENYTSVKDLGVMFEKIYNGQCIGQEEDAAMMSILVQQQDNDKIPALLPSNIQVAHKTGELDGAFHDGGIVYNDGQNYIICIMTEGVKNPENAIKDIAGLSKTTYKFLSNSKGGK